MILEKLRQRFPSLVPLEGMQPIQDGWQEWCVTPRPFDRKDFERRNVGIACGPANGVLVLDVEDVSALRRFLIENSLGLPRTFTVRTGSEVGDRGSQLFYEYPSDGMSYGCRSVGGIFNICGCGAVVPAPGSIHPDSGRTCVVSHDWPLAPAPTWVLRLAQDPAVGVQRRESRLKYPLDDVKAVVRKWLYLEDIRIVDIVLAAFIANQFRSDPSWLIIVGPSSSAKTELLRAFDGHERAYFLSSLTPSTLVSGMKCEDKQKDPSLLLKLDGKTLILKDFISVLSMRSEYRQEILAQLREIYDGQYSKSFGIGKRIEWKGHVGLIAACTPVYDKHYAVIGALGDRFLLYRTGGDDRTETARQAQRTVGREEQMRNEIREAFHKFVNQLDGLEGIRLETTKGLDELFIRLANFCAHARCAVDRDYKGVRVLYEPAPEGPSRLVKQLMQMGMGIAIAHGKDIIDLEVYRIVCKIGRDLIPTLRLRILRTLWDKHAFEHVDKWCGTQEIADLLSMPKRTVDLILEDLMMVGLLKHTRGGTYSTAPQFWQLNKQAVDMITIGLVFDGV